MPVLINPWVSHQCGAQVRNSSLLLLIHTYVSVPHASKSTQHAPSLMRPPTYRKDAGLVPQVCRLHGGESDGLLEDVCVKPTAGHPFTMVVVVGICMCHQR